MFVFASLFLASLLFSVLLHFAFLKWFSTFGSELRYSQRDFVPTKSRPRITPFGGPLMLLSILLSFALIFLFFPATREVAGYPIFLIGLSIPPFLFGLFDDLSKVLSTDSRPWRGIAARFKIFAQFAFGAFASYYALESRLSIEHSIILPFGEMFSFTLPYWFEFVLYTFIIVSFLNAVNVTDGLDSLAAKQFIAVFLFLFFFAIVFFDDRLGILLVLASLFGAVLGFLFFNTHPASIFMGDAGNSMIGTIVVLIFILLGIEFNIPIICFIFTLEIFSCLVQMISFRLFGKRIFKMSPIHHHFQLIGMKDSKIVDVMFWVSICISAVFTLSFLIFS